MTRVLVIVLLAAMALVGCAGALAGGVFGGGRSLEWGRIAVTVVDASSGAPIINAVVAIRSQQPDAHLVDAKGHAVTEIITDAHGGVGAEVVWPWFRAHADALPAAADPAPYDAADDYLTLTVEATAEGYGLAGLSGVRVRPTRTTALTLRLLRLHPATSTRKD